MKITAWDDAPEAFKGVRRKEVANSGRIDRVAHRPARRNQPQPLPVAT
jgi:hypothetical protein